jgi:hypothetical protein
MFIGEGEEITWVRKPLSGLPMTRLAGKVRT